MEQVINAMKKEIEALTSSKAAGGDNDSTYRIYNVPSAKDDFCGRKRVMKDILNYFKTRIDSQAGVVITADGGIGKTELVLEVIGKLKFQYGLDNLERVFRIEAETEQTLALSFKNLALRLKIAVDGMSDVQIRKQVLNKISAKMDPMLLLYDNVKSYQVIELYVPDPEECERKHHVLITSRLQLGRHLIMWSN
jgi:hypothetical protein